MEVGDPLPFPTVPSPAGLMNFGVSNKQHHQAELDSLVVHQPKQRSPWIGAGLDNLGNTCFLNAVVQCLVHTVPLVQTLQTLDHRSRCSCDTEEFCPLCAFQLLMGQCLRTSDGTVEPELLVNNLDKISSLFRRYQQEDAHEFLMCLLDSLENAHSKHERKDDSDSKVGNFVQDIFGGRLRSQMKCCSCGHIKHMFEATVDLSLEIDYADTLTGALESFTNVEKMDDPENKITCEGCKQQVFVEKQLKIDRPPEVIQLHLKRFNSAGNYSNKIDKFLEYPMELDLAPYMAGASNEESLKYDLYAVLVHDGWSAYSGHYYCVVRSSKATWHLMDDSEVQEVPEKMAFDRHAYILFYVRQGSSVWFSSLLKEGLGDAFNNTVHKETSPSSVLDIPSCPMWVSSPQRENLGCTDVRIRSILDDKPVQSWIEQMDSGLRRSASPDADVGEPGISGSGTDCAGSATKQLNISKEDAHHTVTTPPRIEREDDVLRKVFQDESFDDDNDDKENFLLIRPGSGQATPAAQPLSHVKGSGGSRSRMDEILNSQMRQMPSGRRRALMAHMSPTHWSGGSSENRHKKKRRTHSL